MAASQSKRCRGWRYLCRSELQEKGITEPDVKWLFRLGGGGTEQMMSDGCLGDFLPGQIHLPGWRRRWWDYKGVDCKAGLCLCPLMSSREQKMPGIFRGVCQENTTVWEVRALRRII